MIFRQTAFHGGEIAPTFYGRSELDLYKSSLRKCFNMHISHTGQPNKRPGLEFVRAANDQTGSRTVRLVPFMYLNSVAYVLEFSPLKIRVLFEGAVMANVVTTYTAEEIWYLKFAQVGNVLTVCHRAHAPAELRYVSPTSWTLADVDWVPDTPWVDGVPRFNSIDWSVVGGLWNPYSAVLPYVVNDVVVTLDGLTWICVQNGTGHTPALGSAYWVLHSWHATKRYFEGDYAYNEGVLWIALQNNTNRPKPSDATNAAWWALAADLSHPQREWEWTFTLIWRDQYGGVWESMPWATPLTSPTGKWPLGVDRPAKLSVFDVAAVAATTDAREILGIRWYRGRNGIFGYIGESEFINTLHASPAFKDDGIAPDYSRQPPDGTNPFLLGDGTYSYPAGVVFHEGRRVFFGSEKKPQTFWGSSIDSVNRFDQTIPVKASDSYEWTLQADRIEEIRAAASIRNLVFLSGQSEWEVKGNNNGDPISPLAVDAKRQSGWGSSWLDPVFFGYGLLFVQALGTIVRDLTYDFKYGAWAGDDVSHVASHFLDGYQIQDWCFARVPDRVVWMVRSDGKLLSLTYDRNRDDRTMAWALHETDGTVESVCSIPEDGEDRVYAVVLRQGTRMIERMSKITQRVVAARTIGGVEYPEKVDQRYAIHLDCAFVQDGTNTSAAMVQIGPNLNPGATYEVGTDLVMELLLLGADSPFSALTESMIGDEIVLGLTEAPVRLRIKAVITGGKGVVEVLSPVPSVYQTYGHTDWGWARHTVTHPMTALMAFSPDSGDGTGARGVCALADGDTVDNIVVPVGPPDPESNYWQGNTLHLVKPAVVCVLGLSYNADIELLDIAENAEARARIKDVSRVFFETTDSRGLWLGETFDDLVEWTQREVSDEYGLITPKAEIAETFIRATWNRLGRACLRSIDPLPMTLLAVSREVTFGGS